MELTELFWNLFIILFPGVIATYFYRFISTERKYPPFEFLITSATFGIFILIIMELCYSLCSIITSIIDFQMPTWGLNLSIWDALFSGEHVINKNEVFISYLLAIPLSLLISWIIKRKCWVRLLKKLKISNRCDGDVWSGFLEDEGWIMVRTQSTGLVYFGWIIMFSDSGVKREIILKNVTVYRNDTFDKLYDKEKVYLELKEMDFSIEIEKQKNKKQENE